MKKFLIPVMIAFLTSTCFAQNAQYVDDSWTHKSGKVLMTVASDNVGMGSVTPGQKLDVAGTVRALGFIGDGSKLTNLKLGGVWNNMAGNVGIYTLSPVGIGTSSSNSMLTVAAGGTATELVNKGYELIMPTPVLSPSFNESEVQGWANFQGTNFLGYYANNSGSAYYDASPIYTWNGNNESFFYNLGYGSDFGSIGAIQPYGGSLFVGNQGNNTGNGGVYVYNPTAAVSNFVEFNANGGAGGGGGITVPNDSTHNAIFGSTAYSVEYYGRIDDLGTGSAGTIIRKTGTGNLSGFALHLAANNAIDVFISEAAAPKTTLTNNNVFTLGNNVDIIMSWTSGGHPIIYVNGVAVGLASSTAVTTPSNDTANPIYLANNNSTLTSAFGGTFRRLRIWNNYAVTSGDATTLAAGGTIGNAPTGQYLFTEGTGTTTADSSGNANTGTFISSSAGTNYWNTSLFDVAFNAGTDIFMYALGVFKSNLYAGAGWQGSNIYQYDGTSWTKVFSGLSGYGLVDSLYNYNGFIFAGLGGSNAAIISSPDGHTWTTEKTLAGNPGFTRFGEFKGLLYALDFGNNLYVRNNATGTWSTTGAVFTGASQCWGINNYNDALYVGCTVSGGAVVFKSYDAKNFVPDFTNNTLGGKGTEVFNMWNYDGSLYIGMGFNSSTTGDIWRKTDSLGQIVDGQNRILNKFSSQEGSSVTITPNINFTGNVGVSSTAPGQKLDVQGTVRSTGFAMTTAPTTGYVLTAADSSGNASWQPGGGAGGGVSVGTTGYDGVYIGTSQVGSGLILESGSKVAIGTVTPNSTLSIQGAGITAATSSLTMRNSGGGSLLFVGDDHEIGLGTEAPQAINNQYYLTLFNNANALRMMAVINPNAGTSTAAGLDLVTDNTGYIRDYATNTSNVSGLGGRTVLENAGGSGVGIYAFTTGDIRLGGNSNSVMEIGSSLVGIGTINPAVKLDVIGTVRMTGFNLSGVSPNGKVLTSDANGNGTWATVSGTGTVTSANVSSPGGTMTYAGGPITTAGTITGDINVAHNNTWTGQQIFNSQNVGIGSPTPGSLLDVNGTVRALGFTGNATTSTALAANPTNCPAGQYALGITANGTAEGCTLAPTECSTSGCSLNSSTTFNGSTISTAVSENPSNSIGLTANNGSGPNFMAFDSTPALSQAIIPSWSGLHTFGASPYSAIFTNNVGVGSTAPGQVLDVNGTVRLKGFALNVGSSLSGKVLTSDASGNGTWGTVSGVGTVTSVAASSTGSTISVSGSPITSAGTINYEINLTNPNTWTGQQIFNNANVGVGSLTPGQKLDVSGTVRALNFSGPGTGLTGTASSLSIGGNAATVTTNANTTGPITGTGNVNSITSQTGTGTKFVMDTNPVLIGPALGTPASGVLTNETGLPIASGVSGLGTGIATFLATPSSANFFSSVTDESGSGLIVGNISPSLTTPNLGTPSAVVLTNATGTAPSLTAGIANAISSATTTVNVSSSTAPSGGNVLTATDATHATWQAPASGSQWTGTGTGPLTYTSGNVGVGSLTPGQALDVTGTVRGLGFTQIGTSANTFTGTPTFSNATNSALFTGGNVGFGSTNPGQKVDVQGTVRMVGIQMNTGSSLNGKVMTSDASGNGTWATVSGTGTVTSVNVGSTGSSITFTGGPVTGSGTINGDLNVGHANTWTGQQIFNSQNVGIGTASPTQILELEGASPAISFNNTSSSNKLWRWTSSGANLQAIETGVAPVMTLAAGGNVGIGSATPGQTLDVQGTTRISQELVIGSGTVHLTGVTGNLGIGTTAPLATVDINGTARMTGFSLTTGASSGDILVSNGVGIGTWQPNTGGGISSQWTGTGTGPLTYSSGNVGLSSTAPGSLLDVQGTLRVLGSGNVGIGTVTPGFTLDVAGGIRTIGSGTPNFLSNVGIGSATPGQSLDVQGTIRIAQLGSTLSIASGTNGCNGQATLSSGIATVSTTCSPATSSGIFLTDAETSLTNVGAVSVATVTSGSSFVIQSNNASDASKVNWWILKTS